MYIDKRPFRRIGAGQTDGETDQQTRHDRAPETADAAEHDHQKRGNDRVDAHMRTNAPDRRHDDSGDRRQHGAEHEHQQPQPRQIDAERAHDLAVVGAGFHSRTERRLFDQEPDQSDNDDRNACGIEAIGRPDEIAEDETAVDALRHLQHVIARAPGQADRLLDHHRRAKGEQQTVHRVLAVGPPHAELDGDADEADRRRRQDQRRGIAPAERQRDPGVREIGRERRPRPHQLHGEVRAEREQRTMREVDLLHETYDQHEAQRDQREQQAEREAVEDMRK
jgi:hypothetical protein